MMVNPALAEDKAPRVQIVTQHDPVPRLKRSDAIILTHRMATDIPALLTYESSRSQLSREIEQVLTLVRNQCPKVAKVSPVDWFVPRLVVLQFHSQLTDIIAGLVSENSGTVRLLTVNKFIDE